MLTFLLSSLAGAAIGGSYVLIRTPRSGKENQKFVKDFIQTTQDNIDHVTAETADLQRSISHLTNEVKTIQNHVLPDLVNIANTFKIDAAASSRRIQDNMNTIDREIKEFGQEKSNNQ